MQLRQQQEEERQREMSNRPQSSPLNLGSISPSFGAGLETTPGAFYSLGNNNKALQQQMQQQQEANIPIAPTLHWPTVAQAAALSSKEVGAGSGSTTPAMVPPSPKLGSIGSSKSIGGSATTSKLANYSSVVQDKSSTSSSMCGGQGATANNVSAVV
ncbi:hypothetical protein EON65_01085 [archaeon]|nr:MAG: hypothetical protein EON65_01085 [archaeon]